MNLPRKCGKMYIKFDENNQPEYGFEVLGNQIKKFVALTDKEIVSIILPRLVDNKEFDIQSMDENSSDKILLFAQKMKMQEYITGSVKICAGCFKGLNKLRIIVPFENSIMLDWGSFEQNAKVELVLPQNLTLKQIYRVFDTHYDYGRENWTLIGDKRISGQFDWISFGQETFSISEYKKENLDHKVANFTISHYASKDKLKPVRNKEEIVK